MAFADRPRFNQNAQTILRHEILVSGTGVSFRLTQQPSSPPEPGVGQAAGQHNCLKKGITSSCESSSEAGLHPHPVGRL